MSSSSFFSTTKNIPNYFRGDIFSFPSVNSLYFMVSPTAFLISTQDHYHLVLIFLIDLCNPCYCTYLNIHVHRILKIIQLHRLILKIFDYLRILKEALLKIHYSPILNYRSKLMIFLTNQIVYIAP